MRWLSLLVLACFLGSASIADAQVFKPRGSKTGKTAPKTAKTSKSTAKKTGTAAKKSTTTPKRNTKTAAKKAPAKKGKVASARPSDLTPDGGSDADEDYVVIEDLEDDE